jgi:centromere-localized protein 2
MLKACSELEAEIEAVEKESQEVLADIKSTIGDLSDLRYGKFNRVSSVSSDLNQEVIQGLARIEDLCHASGQG